MLFRRKQSGKLIEETAGENPTSGGLSRYYRLPVPIKIIFLTAPVVAITLFIFHWFSIPFFGRVLSGTSYAYLLYAVLGFNIFIGIGATRRSKNQSPPWYDYLMAIALWGVIIFFLLNSDEIAYRNWDSPPNYLVLASAIIMGILSIEAGRRVGGWAYAIVLLVAIGYPLVASNLFLAKHLGGIFYGVSFPFADIISSYAFGQDGILGIPARMLGELILGFFLFAGLIMGMGGGDFFMKLAISLMGRVRGGQAKVAVLASGFFGSITGSAIANIAGTGSFTIPAMKKAGYQPEYAAAIEACSSSGSDTMPPVLGGLVFIMVVIFGADYADVVVAAFLPSILYYLGLLVQVDGYSARNNIRAVTTENLPRWWEVMRDGWFYLAGLAILVFGLVYMRWGAITPIYTAGLVISLRIIQALVKMALPGRGKHLPVRETLRQTWKRTESGLAHTAGLVNYAVAIFLGMGFILVGLLKTGVAAGLAAWIVSLGGNNIYLILLVCVIFCMIMGTFGLERTAYIFLAIIAVPSIMTISKTLPEFAVYGGLPLIGLNLFLIFYSSLGGITPPVALNAFIAANIAGANPMKTAWYATRLGAVLWFLPFFIVLQPSLLIIYTPWWDTVIHLVQAAAGIWLLSSGLEGYLLKLGKLDKYERPVLVLGGLFIAFPQIIIFLIGTGICLFTIAVSFLKKRRIKLVDETGMGARY